MANTDHPVAIVSHHSRGDGPGRVFVKPGSSVLGRRFRALEFEVTVDAKVLAWVNVELAPRLSNQTEAVREVAKLHVMKSRDYKGPNTMLHGLGQVVHWSEHHPDVADLANLVEFAKVFFELRPDWVIMIEHDGAAELVEHKTVNPDKFASEFANPANEESGLCWDDVAVVAEAVSKLAWLNAPEDTISRMVVGPMRELVASSHGLLAESGVDLFELPPPVDLDALEKVEENPTRREHHEYLVRTKLGPKLMHRFFREALDGFVTESVPMWARAWAERRGNGHGADRLQGWVVEHLKSEWMTGIGAIEAAESMLIEAYNNGNLNDFDEVPLEPRDLWTLWDFHEWHAQEQRKDSKPARMTLPAVVYDELLEDVARQADPGVSLDQSEHPVLMGVELLKGGRL